MKRSSILAAIVAFSTLTATANVSANDYKLSTDEMEICRILELAHESSCAEYEATIARQVAAVEANEQKSA